MIRATVIMVPSRLQDDLLQEFRAEKKMIQAQIDLFEPLSVSLRKPAAQRLTNKGLIIFGELLCWALLFTAIAACIFLNKLYPFYLLFELKRADHITALGAQNIQFLQWSVYALIGLSGLLFLFLARGLARIRQKNAILNMAGKQIKTLVGQHLNRKAAIDTIEQRHFGELPAHESSDNVELNLIPNLGFDEE